jgi:hypothetical protein
MNSLRLTHPRVSRSVVRKRPRGGGPHEISSPRLCAVRGGVYTAALASAALACCAYLALAPVAARAAVGSSGSASVPAGAGGSAAGGSAETGSSLEAAASKAGSTGRKVAMSLIGLAFAMAGIVLAFRRDFKEAAGVFAVGIVAVLLATPAGINLLQDTVNSLFGS